VCEHTPRQPSPVDSYEGRRHREWGLKKFWGPFCVICKKATSLRYAFVNSQGQVSMFVAHTSTGTDTAQAAGLQTCSGISLSASSNGYEEEETLQDGEAVNQQHQDLHDPQPTSLDQRHVLLESEKRVQQHVQHSAKPHEHEETCPESKRGTKPTPQGLT